MLVINSAFDIFSLSLIFALIGFSVYLTTSVMNVIDLTCDGSVVLGGCAYGTLVLFGINPIVAFLFAMCLGVLAGFVTSALATHINMEPTFASLITLSAINTFVLKLSSAGHLYLSNLGWSRINTTSPVDNSVIIFSLVAIFCIIFYKIMNSEYGLSMKVIGDGKIISGSLGIDCNHTMWIGLGLANGLASAAGAMITQVVGVFSLSMGTGSLVFGMIAIILGAKLIEPTNTKKTIAGCFLGAVVCKALLELFTYGGAESLGSEYNTVISSVILIFLMASINDHKKKGRLENY